ncbi:helix-turn-helix transcriptional regulator [Nocardia jiangxiensis]|uniref:helix-turn-helix transcriptional regulator n=1 Tax=Nocardia jiangxiensis TaxID=282685 RepID=UPI0005928CEF|nr:helix-turn-helix transcriptional regulator [Nocardia jiangxiensis]
MDKALGQFLRARRELVTPQEVGLAVGGSVRRVPGLRREEVAMLAEISTEYYVRLERGRDRTPSPAVLGALAAALLLDAESAEHLMSLAGRKPPRTVKRPGDHVPHSLDLFLRTITVPAVILNEYGDVLAANAVAQALIPGMIPGTNRLRWEFTDPRAQQMNPLWEQTAAAAIAHLRARVGRDTDDERLHRLIGELSVKSEKFRTLWARHDVHAATGGEVRIVHPTAGPLTLLAEKFRYAGAGGLELLALHPEPGTPTARALAEFAAGEGSPVRFE